MLTEQLVSDLVSLNLKREEGGKFFELYQHPVLICEKDLVGSQKNMSDLFCFGLKLCF